MPTLNPANLFLKAIRAGLISRGWHPTRVIHVPPQNRLTIRHEHYLDRMNIEVDGMNVVLKWPQRAREEDLTYYLSDPNLVELILQDIVDSSDDSKGCFSWS